MSRVFRLLSPNALSLQHAGRRSPGSGSSDGGGHRVRSAAKMADVGSELHSLVSHIVSTNDVA